MVTGTRYTRREQASLAGRTAMGAQAALRVSAPPGFTREAPFEAKEPEPAEAPDPFELTPIDTKDIHLDDGGCYIVVQWNKDLTKGVERIHEIGPLTPHMSESGLIFAAWRMRGYEMNQTEKLYTRMSEQEGQLVALRRELSDALRRLGERGE